MIIAASIQYQRGNMKANTLRLGMNIWPPFLFSGIKVLSIAPDFREVRVELRNRKFNMNYVGVHFGGSMFSMTDPFFMVMLMNILGRDYLVWDKAASIEYLKPGKDTLTAHFLVTDAMLEEVRSNTLNSGDRYLPQWPVEIKDKSGDVVARVLKTLYVRRGKDERKRIAQRL